MRVIKETEPRKLQRLSDPEKLGQIVDKYLLGKPYLLKGYSGGEYVTPEKDTGGWVYESSSREQLPENIVIYNIFNKYIEFRMSVVENLGPEKYLLSLDECYIASMARKYERTIADERFVAVNNIRASRNSINVSLFNIPTSVKVHFKQYQQMFKEYADEVYVDVYDKSKEKFELVRKSGKILYLPDTQNEYCYEPVNKEMFLNYARASDTELHDLIRDYKDKKIVSEMIVPVMYTGHDGAQIPLGYIELVSKTKPIEEKLAVELKQKAVEMVQKMRDSNTVTVTERQKVENISHEGMRLRITNEELKKLLPEQTGLTFDIVFKMTQPITISSEVVYYGEEEGDLIVGVKISGHSVKSGDFSRYYQMVDSLKG